MYQCEHFKRVELYATVLTADIVDRNGLKSVLRIALQDFEPFLFENSNIFHE